MLHFIYKCPSCISDTPATSSATTPPVLRIFALLLSLVLLLSGCTSNTPGKSNEQALSFDDYCDELFAEEVTSDTLSLHYILSDPTAAGICDYTVCLPDYSVDGQEQSQVFLENTITALKHYDRDSLNTDEQLTYDILSDSMEHSAAASAYTLYDDILRPSTGMAMELPILLAEYHFYSEQDVKDYLKLLSLVPECFASIVSFEQERINAGLFMSDTQIDTLLSDIASLMDTSDGHYLLTTFDERLSALSDIPETARDAYLLSNQDTFYNEFLPAYAMLADFLTQHKGCGTNDAGLCYYPDGLNYYEQLVYSSTGSSRNIDALLSLTETQRTIDMLAMADLMETDPTLSLALPEDYAFGTQTPEQILSHLTTAICDQFSAPAATDYLVHDVDVCMQDSCAPAFYLTAPIDDLSHNVIYINPANGYTGIELFTTLAHEGYPGHLYQTTTTASAGLPALRSLLNYPGYIEGWATYVEMLSYSYAGLPANQAALMMHNQSALLSLYATADLSIHGKGWTLSDLTSFFHDYGITNEAAIGEVYTYIVAEPAHYLKYYVGYLEFLELKKAAKAAWGDNYSDKKFHDAVLQIGPAPFAIVEKYLLLQ